MKKCFTFCLFLILLLSCVCAKGLLKYTSIEGLSLDMTAGFEYKRLQIPQVSYLINQKSIPFTVQLMYLFGEKQTFGVSCGCNIRYPLSYYSGQTETTYKYVKKYFIGNPFLLFVFSRENYDDTFKFSFSLGLKYDESIYLYDNDSSKNKFKTVELMAQPQIKYCISDRYYLTLGGRGGYGLFNWNNSKMLGFKYSREFSLYGFLGLGYDF